MTGTHRTPWGSSTERNESLEDNPAYSGTPSHVCVASTVVSGSLTLPGEKEKVTLVKPRFPRSQT